MSAAASSGSFLPVDELQKKIPGFDSALRAEVEATLLDRAQGTFLWVGFVMVELLKKNTSIEIIRALADFPPGLPAIYSRMLRQIDGQWRPVVTAILRWVVMAARPLTLPELTDAVQAPLTAGISRDQAMLDYISLCGPILEVRDEEVHLVHQSARDYLLGGGGSRQQPGPVRVPHRRGRGARPTLEGLPRLRRKQSPPGPQPRPAEAPWW